MKNKNEQNHSKNVGMIKILECLIGKSAPPRLLCCIAIALSIPAVSLAESSADAYWHGTLGPLTIRSLSPAQSFRLAPIPRSPYGLPPGQSEIQFNVAAASIFIEDDPRYLMDFHFTDTRLAFNQGLAGGWSVGISFNDRRIINAHLDQLTEEFHDLFGISQNGRTEVPQNDTRILIPEYSIDIGKEFKGAFSQTIGLSIQKVLVDKSVDWPAIAVAVNMSYETLNQGVIEHGSFDYGLQFSVAEKFSSGYGYANISYSFFGSDESLGLPLKDRQYSGMLGYEFTTGRHQAFIVQYLFSEGAIEDLGALQDVSHEIHLGYKWRTTNSLWELGLVENIVNFDNSPDVALTFGFTYKV